MVWFLMVNMIGIFFLHHTYFFYTKQFFENSKVALLLTSTFVGVFFSSYTILISFRLSSSFHFMVGLVEVNCHSSRSQYVVVIMVGVVVNDKESKFFSSASWICTVINIQIDNPYETYGRISYVLIGCEKSGNIRHTRKI